MNFTLAVYAQERRGDGKTLAKNLIRVCSSLVLIQAEINSELFFFLSFYLPVKYVYITEMAWKLC